MDLNFVQDDDFDTEVSPVPYQLLCEDAVFSLACHPGAPLLAVGQVGGAVNVYRIVGNRTEMLTRMQLHLGGITGMEFSDTGHHLITVSSDKSLNVLDCETQQSIITIAAGGKRNPHKEGLSCLNICSETLVATGDDDGRICIFDMRTRKAVHHYHEHGDFVATMLYFSQVYQLVSGSGDTCVAVYDLRAARLYDVSEPRKDEINALAFLPGTDDIIAGTPSGSLPVWRYGSWSRPYDIYDYHPPDCEVVVTYNDNIVLTGAMDGMLRVLQVHPVKRNLCQLGGNRRRQGISHLAISHDRAFAACADTDNIVNFIDISFLADDSELDQLRSKAEQRHLATLREANAERESKELEGSDEEDAEDSDEESDEDSDEESNGDSEPKRDHEDSAAQVKQPATRKRSRSADGRSGGSDDEGDGDSDDSDDSEPRERTERQKVRERVAAAKWLKEERKKKVGFRYERRRRKTQGFWGDL